MSRIPKSYSRASHRGILPADEGEIAISFDVRDGDSVVRIKLSIEDAVKLAELIIETARRHSAKTKPKEGQSITAQTKYDGEQVGVFSTLRFGTLKRTALVRERGERIPWRQVVNWTPR